MQKIDLGIIIYYDLRIIIYYELKLHYFTGEVRSNSAAYFTNFISCNFYGVTFIISNNFCLDKGNANHFS